MTKPPTVTLTGKTGKLVAQLGPTPPSLSGGYGGFSEVPRPRRQALVEWGGVDPRKWSLQIMFDGFAKGRSVATQWEKLRSSFCPDNGAKEPPRFKVRGAWPLPGDVSVVCNGIQIDEFVKDSKNRPTRIIVTLSLLEWVTADVIVHKNTASRRAKGRGSSASDGEKAKRKTYTVKAGDTLSSIASKVLGDWRRFKEIAALNGLRDPNRLTVGQKLRLP